MCVCASPDNKTLSTIEAVINEQEKETSASNVPALTCTLVPPTHLATPDNLCTFICIPRLNKDESGAPCNQRNPPHILPSTAAAAVVAAAAPIYTYTLEKKG